MHGESVLEFIYYKKNPI